MMSCLDLLKVRTNFLAQNLLHLIAAECLAEGILPEQCKLLAQALNVID